MADLRLVGVHDDGEHLLLSGAEGEIYLLLIDEALRLATSRTPRHPAQSNTPGTRLSPREIQAQIRQGASAEEVAESSGLSLEQVRRYEGPVLAEREHVADQARKVEVAASGAAGESTRSIFGENPVSLEEMVIHRLGTFGIDPKSLVWDAWRVHDGSWAVTADFAPGAEWATTSIGEAAPARWTFHTARKSLFNANRWAQQLSELEPVDGPVPERRLSAVADRPFDFETDASSTDAEDGSEVLEEVSEEFVETDSDDSHEDNQSHGLLDMLRSRRGQRLGFDENGDDELAEMLGSQYQGSHPLGEMMHDVDDAPASQEDHSSASTDSESEDQDSVAAATHAKKRLRSIPFLSLAPSHHEDHEAPVSVHEVSTETREITLSGEPRKPFPLETVNAEPVQDQGSPAETSSTDASADDEDGRSEREVVERLERKATAKPKRSSVPSWDEIVFGTKGD